jgi:hypothetical protein
MAHETTISRRCVCFAGTRNAKLLETYNATAADLEFGKLSSHRKKLIQFCISQNTQRIYHFSVAYAAAPTRGTNRNIIQVLPGDVHHNQGHQHEATGTGLPDWHNGDGADSAVRNSYPPWLTRTMTDKHDEVKLRLSDNTIRYCTESLKIERYLPLSPAP